VIELLDHVSNTLLDLSCTILEMDKKVFMNCVDIKKRKVYAMTYLKNSAGHIGMFHYYLYVLSPKIG
jgi:hypothetical protein